MFKTDYTVAISLPGIILIKENCFERHHRRPCYIAISLASCSLLLYDCHYIFFFFLRTFFALNFPSRQHNYIKPHIHRAISQPLPHHRSISEYQAVRRSLVHQQDCEIAPILPVTRLLLNQIGWILNSENYICGNLQPEHQKSYYDLSFAYEMQHCRRFSLEELWWKKHEPKVVKKKKYVSEEASNIIFFLNDHLYCKSVSSH